MNSSEVKKVIWVINLVIVCVLGMVVFFVYKQLTKKPADLEKFVYVEPPPTEKIVGLSGLITKPEVENVFNWKMPEPPKPEPKKDDTPKPVVKVEEPKSNVSQMFGLETIMGRLVFLTIKKDKLIKSVMKGEEIIDANGAVLGVLQEVGEDSVLILLNGKIETLKMEGLEDKSGASSDNSATNTANSTASGAQNTSNQKVRDANKPDTNRNQRPVEATITPKNQNLGVADNVRAADNQLASDAPKPEVIATHTGNFNGTDFVFNDSMDPDGVLHRRIPEEMATKIQSKESIRILTSTKSYDLVFQANGVLIKNIVDPEARKFFTAFGISDNDVILSVNGQSLGNKTEDDLVALYQQILDSAKYATIELLKDGVRQTFRVSTDRIKKADNK